jgi:hypothetical protein
MDSSRTSSPGPTSGLPAAAPANSVVGPEMSCRVKRGLPCASFTGCGTERTRYVASSRRYQGESVAKLFRGGRANFLAAAEAFDVSGLGGPRQPRPINSAVLPFVLRRCLKPRLGVSSLSREFCRDGIFEFCNTIKGLADIRALGFGVPLSSIYEKALVYAADLHRDQVRKGTKIPYIAHLLSVSSRVLSAGGTEEAVITS